MPAPSLKEIEATEDFLHASPEVVARPPASENKLAFQPQEIVNGRFRITKELGRGGMAVVYLADDLEANRRIALKLMNSQLTGTAKRRFTREFSTIASLKHPNLIEVYEYGESSQGPFFAMEYFPGNTAEVLIGKPLEVVLTAIHDLCLALEFVHKKRIIHRDIKPANILVRQQPDSNLFDIKLSDFGLAKFANTSSSLTGDVNFLGTLAYCGPEQIMREEVDFRADLYALGIVAYELIGGQHPFQTVRRDISRLLTAQITEIPRRLSELRTDISPSLDKAIAHLLEKDSSARPISTAPLRAAIAQMLGWSEAVSANDSIADETSLTGRFVGRQEELGKAEALVTSALSSQAETERILFVTGEAGIGKTSIVRRAARKALLLGGKVYDGRCFDGTLSPFQPFAEILRQMLSELETIKQRAKSSHARDYLASTTFLQANDASTKISEIVEEYATDLVRVGPELRTLLASHLTKNPLEIQRDSQYVYRALARFFLDIAEHQPLCLIIEDLHWADRSTIELLRQIAGALTNELLDPTSQKPRTRLVILCTTRIGTEYRSAVDLVDQLGERKHSTAINLRSVTSEEIPDLVSAILHTPQSTIDAEIINFVRENCFGNPFYITQTVREWKHYQSIQKRDGKWLFTIAPDSQSQIFATMRQAVSERLHKLSENALRVLSLASLVGTHIDIDLLQSICDDLSEHLFLDALDELLARGVLREVQEVKRMQFAHDLYRESAGEGLSKTRRERSHLRIARFLESRLLDGHPVSPGDVGHHFALAGDKGKAYPYFLESAKQAIESQAFRDAAAILDRAEQCSTDSTNKEQEFEYAFARGLVLVELGNPQEATKALHRALSLATTPLQTGRTKFALAKQLSKFEHGPQREALLIDAARSLGVYYPRTKFGQAVQAFRLNCLMILRAERFIKSSKFTDEERLTINLILGELAFHLITQNVFGYTFVTFFNCWMGLTSQNRDIGVVSTIKFCMAISVTGQASGRFLANRWKHAESSTQSIQHPGTKSYAQVNLATLFYVEGKLETASRLVEESLKYLERTQDYYHLYALHSLRHTKAMQGDSFETYHVSIRERQVAEAIGEKLFFHWAIYGQAEALGRMGHTEQAIPLVEGALDALGADFSRSIARAEQGRILLQASKYGEAAEAARQGIKAMYQDFFLFEWAIHSFANRLEALVGPDWSLGPGQTEKAQLRAAQRASYSARFYATQHINARPQTYRACGRLMAAKGKRQKATKWFEDALQAAKKSENHAEQARALIDLALIDQSNAAKERCLEGLAQLDQIHTVLPAADREIIRARFGIDCTESYPVPVIE